MKENYENEKCGLTQNTGDFETRDANLLIKVNGKIQSNIIYSDLGKNKYAKRSSH